MAKTSVIIPDGDAILLYPSNNGSIFGRLSFGTGMVKAIGGYGNEAHFGGSGLYNRNSTSVGASIEAVNQYQSGEVFRHKSNLGGSPVYEGTYIFRTTTNTNIPRPIASLNAPSVFGSNTFFTIESKIRGTCTDSTITGGSTGHEDYGLFTELVSAFATDTGNNLRQVGTTSTTYLMYDNPSWQAYHYLSGNFVHVMVQGAAEDTVLWHSVLTRSHFST